ncbi:MAG: transporter substrate-binding domain-containing protein [Desulfobacterales bacterium]
MRAPKCKWIGSDSGLILVLTMIAFLMFPSVAPADGMEDARRRGRLIVGVRTDFPPYGFVNEKGAISGFDAEIARYLAQAMFDDASRVDLVKVTGGSRISYLYSGWVDLIIAATTVSDERTRVLEFSEP